MTDIRKTLLSRYQGTNLYSNFGAVIKSMTVDGFRGLSNLRLDFEFPITAISGTNGSGKSTIGQLAVCAYKQPSTNKKYKRRYVKDFFPVSQLDPTPFTSNATVKFQYATNATLPQDLTVSRMASEWSGYKRQPERHSFYVGFALYIPKVERKDLSIYKPGSFTVGLKRLISDEIKTHVSSILNNKYDEVSFQAISHKNSTIELGLVSKYGYSYSENNMGFGEGRLMYMIDLFENEPDNSLFILEEPETSLHEDAQYKFIKYLMDVCNRKKHQIILSTHSSIILDALPPEARKFIIRDTMGVKVLDRVSAARAKSILTDGNTKALTVCVEDVFAQHKLREAIRKLKPNFLTSIQISPMGDTLAVANTVKLLRGLNVNAIGVRDADIGENTSDKLFKLPGTLPPEKEVYENSNVQAKLNSQYSFDIATIFSGFPDIDHHQYGKILADKAYCSEEAMHLNAISAYFDAVGINTFNSLIAIIENEI
jgi:predicted ATPase